MAKEDTLVVHEIYASIQGESTFAGLPCTFVRLTGCNLRCSWCDTPYAFHEGKKRSLDEVLDEVDAYGCPLVEITGGEPLLQLDEEAIDALHRRGFTVAVETNGTIVAPRGLDVHSVLQTVKQVQQAGTPFAVILTQVPHQGGEGSEASAGFAAKGVTLFDSRLHYRKDFYKATPLGLTAAETEPDSKAAAELRAAYAEAKRLSGYATKPVSEAA